MKLRKLFLLLAVSMIFGTSASAKVGDAIGNIYTTDIMADVDGMPIKSYNIGGRTAVVIEDLRDYGFYVEWNSEKRSLTVKTEYKPVKVPTYNHVKKTPGKIAGKIYETDIKVTVNGIEVPSFNLGGITAVAIEDMVDLEGERYSHDGNSHQGMDRYYADTGMYYVWYGDARRISLNTLRPGYVVNTDFGEFTITSPTWSLERMTYINSWKSLAKRDGKYYNHSAMGLEINGEVYLSFVEAMDVLGARPEKIENGVDISIDTENAVQVQYANSLTAKTCFNILYPLKGDILINGKASSKEIQDFYLYKGKLFVSVSALNDAAGKDLFNNRYDLPKECEESIGKTLYSKHMLFINGYAITSYLAENGEYYIPVDELSRAEFEIQATHNSRDILSPEKLPNIDKDNNYPSNYFSEDYENKGYHCMYYESLHSVTIDGEPISSIYLHYPDTHLTPLIPLGELVEKAGYSIKKENDKIWVNTNLG